jgi:2,3-bisphosphoglycerate-independent phosphoglycerate mutase
VSPSNNPDSEGLRWRSSKLADNEILNNFITQNKVCHLMGLFSAGGVHSSIDHFFWAINFLRTNDVTIRAHLFLDGRDVAYNDALETLRTAIQTGSIRESEIATIQGRFYAMDRDNRIERTQAAYDAIVAGSAELTTDEVIGCIERFYERGIFDEVIPPVIMQPFSGASPEDSFWMLNFRTDRIRQILKMLTDDGRRVLNMVPCGADIDSKASVIFDVPPPQSTLGEILARHGISQLRIAETEKYAHVTYFLNGGSDVKFNLEDRVLIPSPKVKDYSETPAMSSREIASSIIKAMEASSHQVIIANFANADMLGHTGNFEATVESIKILDDCVRDVMECASTNEYIVILTADHGNAEKMLGPDMTPIKTHTCSKVPFVIVPQTDGQFKIPETLADISGIVTEILGA